MRKKIKCINKWEEKILVGFMEKKFKSILENRDSPLIMRFQTVLSDGKQGFILKSDSSLIFTIRESYFQNYGIYGEFVSDNEPLHEKFRLEVCSLENNDILEIANFRTGSIKDEITLLMESKRIRGIMTRTFKFLKNDFTANEAFHLLNKYFQGERKWQRT